MAIAGPTPTPIIVEPAPSVQVPSPASLVTSSLDPNSSSDSYNSSRPQSQYSSDTSQSELPSPLDGQCRTPEIGTSPNDIELSSLAPPVLGPPSPSVTPPVSHATSENGPPRSVPPHPFPTETIDGSQEFGINNRGTSLATLRAKIHERRWLENTIGVLGVAVAIWLGVRGYKLAVWQSWNDLRQTCAAYKQVTGSKRGSLRISC